MPVIDASVPYHQQDDDDYCGAAAAQMMLAAMVRPVYDQRRLYQAGLSGRFTNHGTSPFELRTVLNDRQPSGNEPFGEHFDPDSATGCQRIAATLALRQNGVPAIVRGDEHWVVVTAVQLDGDPASGPPYEIKGFFINDPSPMTAAILYARDPQGPRPPPLPMPHASGDHCGDGGEFGSADTYVTLGEWEASHWARASTAFGQTGFVTVSNGPPLPPVSPRRAQRALKPGAVPGGWCFSEEAANRVRQGISDHRIDTEGPLAKHIAGYTVGEVIHVTEIGDPPRRSCQLALMRDGDQIGTASVDSDTGEFLSVQAPPSVIIEPTFRSMLARRALERHAATLRDLVGPAALHEDSFTIHPTFVWRPCRESMSPYNPFVQVNLAGAIVYVGLDGRVHRELTPHGVK